MRLNHVPARTGLLWVKLGIRTFLRQPLALAGLFFMFMMAVSVLTLVPIVGAALALALLPAATLGLMAATRDAASGNFPMPAVLASAFRAGQERMRAMMVLGGMYAIGSFVVMGLSALLTGDLGQALQPTTEITEEALRQPAMLRQLLVNMVLYIPLGLLFWHAPALVHWHGVSPAKSLFFSAMACWTNKGAMLVYFLAWSGVFLGFALAVVTLASFVGGPQLLGVLMFPMAMLMSAMFFTSLYFTFRDSFVTDDGQAPA
ncbi:BPSS1780 family membrane protein [Hydrogenophaga aquatica]